MDLLLETAVHPVEVYLFDADLTVSNGILDRVPERVLDGVLCGIPIRAVRADRGLLSLSGHRAPF
ncbi:hypothetical protein ACFY0P_14780 [Streptomyces sp. NPDC001714]|uniref:hypothetical protein n=1 Tax=Streptomyces sp. NPDC001714 TaxID=3364603 RepID=UPI00368DE081